jgi:surface antigen
MAASGCSLPLDTMFEKADGIENTGSAVAVIRPVQAAPTESDLASAGAVAVDALSRGGKDNSVPWENPRTGAAGNVTPLATAYNEGALFCRDFLASYQNRQFQAWLKGEACRTEHGRWEVKSLKQLRQG